MRLSVQDPPRRFAVGAEKKIVLADCAHIGLDANEQITLETASGGEFDVARKSWGFYATPSLNGRLVRFGLHPVLARNGAGQFFVLLVEQGCEDDFEQYCRGEGMHLVCRMDSTEALEELRNRMGDAER